MVRLQHCAPGHVYFEKKRSEDSDSPITVGIPSTWREYRFGPWRGLHPHTTGGFPLQGWKIHVSSRPHDVERILQIVSDICFRHGVRFKHLATIGDYRRATMKYAHRASAGKFITVFPRDDDEFCLLLKEFDEELSGSEGPYVLSDVRFGTGPVFFRYGGFALDPFEGEDGSPRFAIRTPNGGRIEDTRSAVFTLPDFVTPPALVRELVQERLHPDAKETETLLHPYLVKSSLHFSNGGGVYLATHRETGEEVVLKEARRWAAYSSDTTDATERLRNEHRALEALAQVGAVVNPLGYRALGEHEFLIEEHITGVTLQSWAAGNFPFSTDPERIARYAEHALPIAMQIVSAVDEIHAAGWAVLDLQPKNILVDPQGRVRLIDMEAARLLSESAVGAVGTPGFIPHAWCSNADRDRYALAAVVLHLFWPSLAGAFAPATLRHRHVKAAALFPQGVGQLIGQLMEGLPDEVLATTHGFRLASPAVLDRGPIITQLRDGIRRSRNESAEAERRYPGDAIQFTDGPGAMLNIETGAAGVALMLARAGEDVRADVAWLAQRLHQTESMPFHGLLRGRAGIAASLAQLGASDTAELLVLGSGHDDPGQDLSLRTGLAGTVLSLIEISERTGQETIRDQLKTYASLLSERASAGGPLRSLESETGNAVGLFDGWAGVGLTCRRLAEFTGDRRWDRLMGIAFDREIEQLVISDDGSLRVDYSGVSYGYLSEGAAGIAFALASCAPQQYAGVIHGLTTSFDGIISMNGGLFRGTTGIAAALLPLSDQALVDERERLIRFTQDSFFFHRDGDDGLMFLGDNGYHLSADYSTGAAGVLGMLLAHQTGNPSLWFPVSLPSPIHNTPEGGEQDERIALAAGTAR